MQYLDASAFSEYSTYWKGRVEELVQEILPHQGRPQSLYDKETGIWAYPSRKSKKLRALLTILICQTYGGNPEHAVPAGAFTENFQNWILGFDDIQDHSKLRRGKPTLHRKIGIPKSINVNSHLRTFDHDFLAYGRDNFWGNNIFNAVLEDLNTMIKGVGEGQHEEFEMRDRPISKSKVSDYVWLASKKTCTYTTIWPVRVGAIIAGRSKREVDSLGRAAMPLGLAFQNQDDLLNLNLTGGDAYGKTPADDLDERKHTWIAIETYRRAMKNNSEDADRYLELFGKKRKTIEDKNELIEMSKKYNVQQYISDLSENLMQMSIRRFDSLLPDNVYKKFTLEYLRSFVVRLW